MKKHLLTLFAVALTFVATTQQVSANGNPTFSEKRVVLTILTGQIDREMINDLRLNEMQYIQLKDLNKSYKNELAGIKLLTAPSSSQSDSRVSDLVNKYFSALNQVLSPQQIKSYVETHGQLANR